MRDMFYYKPKSYQEACELLDNYQDDAKLIAGGQSLMVLLRQKVVMPKHLIDLKDIQEGSYIKEDTKNGYLQIGALTTHRQIEMSPVVREKLPVLAEVVAGIGSVQVRNWGTIGGSLAHADPAGDLAPLLIALGAKVRIASRIRANEMLLNTFIRGYLETELANNELLKEIIIPLPSANTGMAYKKEAIRAGDMALTAAAAVVELGPKGISRAVITLAAVSEKEVRLTSIENELTG